MSVVELNWRPSDRQLRQFSAICLFALPLLGWFFSGRLAPSAWEPFHVRLIGGLAVGGAAIAVVGLLRPQAVKWIFLGMSIVAFPIGLVFGEVTMLLIYAVAFVPTALVFRLIGRDALDRKLDRSAASYWRPKEQPKDAASYFRQS